MTTPKRYQKRLMMFRKKAPIFKSIFGFEIAPYVDVVLGFDIIKLEEAIKVPDDISCRDFVEGAYGNSGVTLLLELMEW